MDTGSRLDGIVAHMARFREIEVFDNRALESAVTNLLFRQVEVIEGFLLNLLGTLTHCPVFTCWSTLAWVGGVTP